ncbi:MAG: hypothetical protein EXS36_17910, partial [Pedosphaera sp.]|nr:hypothetical protein [Pedosphaera sp.]
MTTAAGASHPKPPPPSRMVAGWLLLSLLLHMFVAGEYWLVQQAALRWPAKVPSWIRDLLPKSSPRPNPADPEDRRTLPLEDPSLVFVEVDPQAVSEEAPDKTPFYSTANSLAAQVTPAAKEVPKPQIDGQQEKLVRTFENPKPKPVPPVTQPPAPKVQ